ncbi:MAG TPA: DUF4440 domain-containing protein [Gemmatimonadaceae bacterium]|nr:DUF4440 domain-containing protein [Gemmatimonadaceae bacterium]
MRRLLPSLALPVALIACQPAGEAPPTQGAAADPAAARTAIDEANARGARAMNARDRAAWLDLYGERATLMSVGAPDLVGRAAIDSSLGAEWEAAKDSGIVITWKADTIEVHGDYAYEVGHGQSVRSKQGGADTTRTRYITFWRKEADGAWRVSRDFTVTVPKSPK